MSGRRGRTEDFFKKAKELGILNSFTGRILSKAAELKEQMEGVTFG